MTRTKQTEVLTGTRPWWQMDDAQSVRERVKDLPYTEVKAISVEIKASLKSLTSQIETSSPEIAHVRELVKRIGPPAVFQADVLSDAIVKRYEISREDADGLVDELDWWRRARGAISYLTEKQGIIDAELTRRRGDDAEQAIYDVKGKINRVIRLIDNDDTDGALSTALEIRERLKEATE